MATAAKSDRIKALEEAAVEMLYEKFHAIKTPRDAELANAPKHHPVLMQDVSTTFFSDEGWSTRKGKVRFFIPTDDATTALRWGYWVTAQYLKDGSLQLIGKETWSSYGDGFDTLLQGEVKSAAAKFIKGNREVQAILKG